MAEDARLPRSPTACTLGDGRPPSDDFRQHFGFLGIMLICGACSVYLMGILRPILRPFLWALFLVMGLTPAVAFVERSLLCTAAMASCCCGLLLRCICFCGRLVFGRCCGDRCRRYCWGDGAADDHRATRRKYSPREALPSASVIGPLGSSDGGSSGVVDASPLDREAPSDDLEPDEHSLKLRSSRTVFAHAGDEDFEFDALGSEPWGGCAIFIAHSVAIAIVVALVISILGGFVLLVVQSVVSLQDHWAVYKQGAINLADSVNRTLAHASGGLPAGVADEIASNALARAEELLSAVVTDILSNVWRFILEVLMMGLYIAFWLASPMPVGSKVEELFKRYIILKGLACLGYGICVGVLLQVLGIDLAAFFGLAAFMLSFVPEVGAIVAMLLPAPVIVFDSRLESPAATLAVATFAQLGLKFVFANVVEVKLVEADRLMKMHPVIILLAVTFFGLIWGPTGMLLSVPLVAYFKVALLSESVPDRYRNPVLVLLEGDRCAPAKYATKRRQVAAEIRRLAGRDPDTEATTSAPPSSSLGLRTTAAGTAASASSPSILVASEERRGKSPSRTGSSDF